MSAQLRISAQLRFHDPIASERILTFEGIPADGAACRQEEFDIGRRLGKTDPDAYHRIARPPIRARPRQEDAMSATQDRYLVISCDGGGIRGLMTALLLRDLSQDVLDRVHLYAGNSTGSYIALGLASGISIDQLTEYYLAPWFCEGIFTPYEKTAEEHTRSELMHESLVERFAEKVERKLEDVIDSTAMGKVVDSLLYPQYSNEGRLGVIERTLPGMSVADLWTEQGKHALAATFALDMQARGRKQWEPTVISNLPGNDALADTPIVDAAMCSTSAPIAWAAWQLPNGVHYADGALYANNPSAVTLAALSKSGILGDAGLGKVYMLSLDTGFNFGSYPIEKGLPADHPWGMLGWMWPLNTETVQQFPLMAAYNDGASEGANHLSQELLGPERYRRARIWMEQENISFTDCSAVPTLEKLAKDYMETDAWKEIKGWVEENFV